MGSKTPKTWSARTGRWSWSWKIIIDPNRQKKLRTEIAVLKAHNEYLETENTALKKLEETERELISGKRGMKQNIKQLKKLKKKDSK